MHDAAGKREGVDGDRVEVDTGPDDVADECGVVGHVPLAFAAQLKACPLKIRELTEATDAWP